MRDDVPDGDDDDPFAGLELDEAFISSAPRREKSADERIARLRRIDDEHRRLARERGDERTRLAKQLRKEHTGRRRRVPLRSVVVLVAVGGLALYLTVGGGDGRATFADSGVFAGVVSTDHRPKASTEEQSAPIGTPDSVPAGVGPYAFIHVQANSSAPGAYDPCRPIHVVFNDRTVIADGDQIVREALDRATVATGLHFVIDGTTDEVPREDRAAYQPERYPDRWAPVLVAWSDSTEAPKLSGQVAGEGGSSYLQLPSRGGVYVSGLIELDGPDLSALLGEHDGRAQVRAVVLHEIGHLLGLGHTNDATQIMNPDSNGKVLDYAVGDLQGLALLGRGSCFPDL